MRRIIFFIAFGLFGLSSAVAAPVTYTLVNEKSSLKFFAIQNSAPVEGKFTDYTATIVFDTDAPEKGTIEMHIKTGSLQVGNDDVKSNIKLPEWLSTEAFPTAVFKSTKISRMPQSDNYFAEGKLTLKGKSVPVIINFQLQDLGEAQIATGQSTLHRNDFGIGQGQWAKDDVIKKRSTR